MMMTKRMSFSLGAVFWALGLVTAALALGPVAAQAQPQNPCIEQREDSFDLLDHRYCFKAGKKDLKVRGVLDLYTPQFGFFSGCTIWETWTVCAPANKEVEELRTKRKGEKYQPTEPLPLEGRNALGNFDSVCYRMKCDKSGPANVAVLDQFGTRTFEKLEPFMICNSAVKVCQDPDRSTYVGSCSEFNENPDACQGAWQATGDGLASSCFYDDGACRPCAQGEEDFAGCTNTCVSCAADLSLARGFEGCRAFGGDQAACESHWTVGEFGPGSCFYDEGACKGCGPKNELDGICSNQCRS